MYRTITTNQPQGWVYFLTNKWKTVLYIGVTNNLIKRVQEHRDKIYSTSFTAKYNCEYLVYYEGYQLIQEAIAREKQLKKWHRTWKNALVDKVNVEWKDLYGDLLEGKMLGE